MVAPKRRSAVRHVHDVSGSTPMPPGNYAEDRFHSIFLFGFAHLLFFFFLCLCSPFVQLRICCQMALDAWHAADGREQVPFGGDLKARRPARGW